MTVWCSGGAAGLFEGWRGASMGLELINRAEMAAKVVAVDV